LSLLPRLFHVLLPFTPFIAINFAAFTFCRVLCCLFIYFILFYFILFYLFIYLFIYPHHCVQQQQVEAANDMAQVTRSHFLSSQAIKLKSKLKYSQMRGKGKDNTTEQNLF
jgi:fatty acid desaturase